MPSTPKIISTINSTIDFLLRDTRGSKLFSSWDLVQLIYKGMLDVHNSLLLGISDYLFVGFLYLFV